eukprot:gene23204-30078_t
MNITKKSLSAIKSVSLNRVFVFHSRTVSFTSSTGCRCGGAYCIRSARTSQHLTKCNLSSFSDGNNDSNVQQLLINNRNWVRDKKKTDPHFFTKLGVIHNPKYLYIGCSDSRLPVHQILGLNEGDVFVHRNVGNLVPSNDLNALSVVEYAISNVGVTDIIVTGHYDCGAVRAATSRQDLGLLEHWLRQIRDVHRLHKEYLDLIEDEEKKHSSLVELNVVEQCLNLYKTGAVQRAQIEVRKNLLEKQALSPVSGFNIDHEVYPRIHGLVFDPANGQLKKLKVDFSRRIGSLEHIYKLYD